MARGRYDRGAILEIVGTFIDRARSVTTERELHSLMEDLCRELGFRYFALIHHADLRNAHSGLININNYPPIWRDIWIEQQLWRIDPVVHACFRTCVGFHWSDLSKLIYLNTTHREVLAGAARENLADGMTIPGCVIGERNGSCSFGGPRDDLVIERCFLIGQLIGAYGFEAARRIANGTAGRIPAAPVLNRRQRECAVLAGRGMKDHAIAHELGISYRTVVNHLDAARKRYRVCKREQLVICAVLDGEISLAELDTRRH